MSRSLTSSMKFDDACLIIVIIRSLLKLLPTLILIVQFGLFHSAQPQPLVFDASQYVALSTQWSWWGPFPTLPADGLRTYAYPVLISIAGSVSFLLLLQCAGLIALMWGLRQFCLPKNLLCDGVLSIVLLTFPILIPYALTVLADLPGVVSLQAGLLLLSWAMFSRRRTRWVLFALAGGLLSWSIQLRPAYAHVVWLPIFAFLWSESKQLRTSGWSARTFFKRSIPFAAGAVCFVVVALPTIVTQARENHRLSYLPGDETNRLLGYHLMLGLSLDRWSSNPPPLEERHNVEVEWQKRGWAMLPVPPNVTPSIKDFKREVRRHPVTAAWQFAKHVYYAFSKRELFPYAGRPSLALMIVIAMMNVMVLSFGTFEAIRLALFCSLGRDRLFAAMQLALLADLVLTCGMVVPEERFTLAIYPPLIVFASAAIARAVERKAYSLNLTPTSGNPKV